MKRMWVCVCAVLLCVSLFCGCGCAPDKPEDTTEYKEGGSGVISLPLTHFDTFNPVLSQSDTVADAMSLVYDSLYVPTADGGAEPRLALKTQISPDGLVYTVHLRDDVYWHDGKQFSAYDVSYTLSAIKQAETSKLKKYLYGIASYEALSNFVLQITLTEPDSCFISHLDFPVVARGTDCTTVQADYIPIGTAAYRYTPSKPGRIHLLTKYDACVTRKSGAVEQVVLKEIPSADNVMYALESREIEAVHVDSKQLCTYSPKGNVTTMAYTNRTFSFLGIHAQGALEDKRVRSAVSLLLDRESIKNNALFGRFVPSILPFVPGSVYNPDNEAAAQAAQAAELLQEAGYEKSTSGRWQKETEDGAKELYIPILVNADNEMRVRAAQEIARQLSAFGIGTYVDQTDYETYALRVETLEYSMFLGETVLGDALDVGVFLGTMARFASPGDARMDALLRQAQTAVSQSQKDTAFFALVDSISDEVPIISLGFGQNAVIVNDRIAGEITPIYGDIFHAFEAWNAK